MEFRRRKPKQLVGQDMVPPYLNEPLWDDKPTPASTPAPRPAPAPARHISSSAPSPAVKPAPATKTVEIKIHLPAKLTVPKVELPQAQRQAIRQRLNQARGWRPPRRAVLALGGLCLLAGLGYGGYRWWPQPVAKTTNTVTVNSDGSKTENLSQGTPDYPTVLPAGKSIEQLGGWTRVSPADRNPVFAYADVVNGTPVNVSQQPLPEDFKNDTAVQIEELAKGYKADEKITIGEMVIYIGTSAKGPQSVILHKNELLILIRSSAKIDSNHWVEYINSLG